MNYGPQNIAMSGLDAPRTTPEMELVLQRLDSVVNSLHENVSLMEQRLVPILRRTPEPIGKDERDNTPSSPLGEQLHGITKRMESANAQLQSLLMRLAL